MIEGEKRFESREAIRAVQVLSTHMYIAWDCKGSGNDVNHELWADVKLYFAKTAYSHDITILSTPTTSYYAEKGLILQWYRSIARYKSVYMYLFYDLIKVVVDVRIQFAPTEPGLAPAREMRVSALALEGQIKLIGSDVWYRQEKVSFVTDFGGQWHQKLTCIDLRLYVVG